LSQARRQIRQLEGEAAEARAATKASLQQVIGVLEEERRKSARLDGDLTEAKQSNAALLARAQIAEQEQASAINARRHAEQTTAEAEQAVARERASATSIRAELDQTRLELDAATALSNHVASEVQEALDEQRETTVALARDFAAVRDENDSLRAERRKSHVKQPPKPNAGSQIAGKRKANAESQKTARNSRSTLPVLPLPDELVPEAEARKGHSFWADLGFVSELDSGPPHGDWCYAHYRSYNPQDDTWQPFDGPRRRCISPGF
jgi:hypothetical protein